MPFRALRARPWLENWESIDSSSSEAQRGKPPPSPEQWSTVSQTTNHYLTGGRAKPRREVLPREPRTDAVEPPPVSIAHPSPTLCRAADASSHVSVLCWRPAGQPLQGTLGPSVEAPVSGRSEGGRFLADRQAAWWRVMVWAVWSAEPHDCRQTQPSLV